MATHGRFGIGYGFIQQFAGDFLITTSFDGFDSTNAVIPVTIYRQSSKAATVLSVKEVSVTFCAISSPLPIQLFPVFIRILHQHGVEVLGVAGDLFAKPCGLVERFVLVREFDFGDGETVVIAIELVDFPGVLAIGVLNKIACLVDDTRLTDFKELLYFLDRDFLFPFKTGGARGVTNAFDGDEALVALHTHADGALGHTAEIALGDARGFESLGRTESGSL